MRRGPRSTIVLLAALGLALTSCVGGGGFKIGGLMPLTGSLSDFGPASAEAVKLAADLFESAATDAGLDLSIEVVVEDDQTEARAGVEGATKLVDTDNVKFIVGPMGSDVVLPVAQSVTIKKKIVTITPSATSGKITALEDDGLINRTPPSDEYQAPLLADLVAGALGKDATVALGARNDAYGTFIIDGLPDLKLNGVKQELEERGLETLEPVFWDPKGTTFSSEAERLTKDSPDGWVLVDFPGTWQKMSAALVQTGKWDPAKTFSADGLKTSKLPSDPPAGAGKEATEGMRGTAPGATGATAFQTLWNEKVGQPKGILPETFAPQTLDATLLGLLAALRAAVETAGGGSDAGKVGDAFVDVTSVQIAANLAAVSRPPGTTISWEKLGDAIKAVLAGQDIDYDGASGPVNLDKDGNVESVASKYDVYEFKDGKLRVTEVLEAEALP